MAPKTQLYMIAAMSENRVIGSNNHLPWHLPDEWKHFKKVTGSKPFLMGRKSFEAPDALHSPYLNVIITSDPPAQKDPATIYAKDISAALALLADEKEVFVLGGASVFSQMLPLVHKLFLTIVHTELAGDAFFPVVDQNDWTLVSSEYHGTDEAHAYAFSMNVYERRKPE